MRNKLRIVAAYLAAALSLTACSSGSEAVRVERMDSLTVAATVADRFAGVVVSDNSVQVSREMDKSIKELLVKPGDQVKQGQKLFSYDTDELNLTLDKQELEQDRIEAQIKDLKASVTELEKKIKAEKDANTKATLELNLRQTEMDLRMAEYEEDALAADIKHTKQMLKNVNVYSPVAGTVRAIDEDSAEGYIILQQSGAYRVKGTVNELSMNMGIMEGVKVTIISRLNPDRVWKGTVEFVDYENAQHGDQNSMYMGYTDPMTTSTSYPFYIALEDTEGLLLGQHVYIQLEGTELPEGNYLPQSYLMDITTDELGASTATVWAVGNEDKLEKRTVTLGYFDLASGSYEILDGLTEEDYVADPADPACREGAEVIKPAEPAPTEPPEETTEPLEGPGISEEPMSGQTQPTDPALPEPEPSQPEETEPAQTETTKPTESPFGNIWGNKG